MVTFDIETLTVLRTVLDEAWEPPVPSSKRERPSRWLRHAFSRRQQRVSAIATACARCPQRSRRDRDDLTDCRFASISRVSRVSSAGSISTVVIYGSCGASRFTGLYLSHVTRGTSTRAAVIGRVCCPREHCASISDKHCIGAGIAIDTQTHASLPRPPVGTCLHHPTASDIALAEFLSGRKSPA